MLDYEAGHRDPETTYFSSKIFAEKAVWKFIQDNKGQVPWDVTVINPPFVSKGAENPRNGIISEEGGNGAGHVGKSYERGWVVHFEQP
ncbi:hypothetical protein FA13DRAFT_1815334 [Coprinellus micaceus]|uniref:NAD-dependent epimerase/dehydratase domain-containing protein n=1 Tax=Coprinellus micaceus TaxID=71717 RepID=A0A4Y7T5E7_COPMI|nr:hypothetical protein FA13DRAFT_1815334 [Coprinellus micaceus]